MKHSDKKVTGILLAGGRSNRMGREKGSLSLGGRKLYQYPLRVLEALCDEILVSSCQDKGLEFSHPMVCDERKELGPMGGILTCLKHSSNDLNMVLSYDMPLVNKGLIRHLIDHSRDADLVVPGLHPDRPEPLCALYRKSLAKRFLEMADAGEFAVHKIIGQVNSSFLLIEPGMPFYHPDLFLNVNHPSDLEGLSTKLENEN